MFCRNCNKDVKVLVIHNKDLWCRECAASDSIQWKIGSAPSMIGDECDVLIRHGLCNDDGSPRRFTSKEAIKKAAFEVGLFQGGDTPKVNNRLIDEREQRKLNQN